MRYDCSMTNAYSRKKAGLAPGPESDDWHRADIKAALEKAGWSLRQLSIHHGLTPKTFQHAMSRPYPKGERAIAEAIGELPQVIWPSRYGADGLSNRRPGRKPKKPEHITPVECSKGECRTETSDEVNDE